MVLTAVSVVAAVIVGIVVKDFNMTPSQIYYLSFPGVVFLNILKMLILPLIFFSILAGNIKNEKILILLLM